MRATLFTTVAAAALSLSLTAVAQTGGAASGSATGGASGGASATTSGGVSGGASGTTSGGATVRTPGGSASTSGDASGTTSATSSGSTAGTSGTASGSASGSASQPTGSAATQQQGGAASTTGSTTAGGSTNINVTSEQRTQITQSFRSVDVEPVTNVNFSVSVGSVVPASVTTLYDCPDTVESILTGLPECKYVVVKDQIVILEPSSRRIVTVIERRG